MQQAERKGTIHSPLDSKLRNVINRTSINSENLTTMKLNDLIKSYNWLSIELTLIQLYPDQETMIDDYRNVFEKLTFLVPEENEMSIVLTEYDSYPDDESEVGTYVDVSGRKTNETQNSMTDSYAIEFVPWEKWLGMDLAPETIEKFSDLEIVAHCLYEMTFIGYSDEEISEQFESINERVDEYKNLTKEEKEEKTISLDELQKLLNKKGRS
ncbi:MAG: hypothetical protein NTZ33_05915 [Bacteroidetes bacterium]|nr:hypothetical protein [Bacteroidota bacterium]